MQATARAFDAVLFDWDGTLYDSVPACFSIYKKIFSHFGVHTLEMDEWRENFCADYRRYYLLRGIPREDLQRVDEMWLEEFAKLEKQVHLFPDAKETLALLHAKGVKLALVSNGSGKRIRAELSRHGIASYFDSVVTMDEAREFKPSPESILTALSKLNAGAARSLYVGDMAEDILAGKRAGTRTAAVLTGVHCDGKLAAAKPDHVFESVSGVLSLFGIQRT